MTAFSLATPWTATSAVYAEIRATLKAGQPDLDRDRCHQAIAAAQLVSKRTIGRYLDAHDAVTRLETLDAQLAGRYRSAARVFATALAHHLGQPDDAFLFYANSIFGPAAPPT